MTSREFCYWLQGFFELAEAKSLTVAQMEMIKRHLSMVFRHEIDPEYGDDLPEMQGLHSNAPSRDDGPVTC